MEAADSQDKPRRLEDETVNYLKQIDAQFTDKIDDEERTILIQNVLTEIKTRTASALCDRNTNYLLEKMCTGADVTTILEILERCTPYAVFLARNRYSSHVLQTLISRLCYIIKFEDYGAFDKPLDVVTTTVLAFVSPIMAEMSWLSKELSATHVIRSIVCLLAGIPMISEKKGKGSKHSHSVGLSEPIETLLEPNRFYISKSAGYTVPVSFHELLVSSVQNLLDTISSRELQMIIADASGAAVLGLLVRVLSSPYLVGASDNTAGPGPELCSKMFSIALSIPPPTLESDVAPCSVFYAMAGDRSGSYFLESLIECCSLEFLLGLLKCTSLSSGTPEGVYEYADDNCGNFVLQAVLRRLTHELSHEINNLGILTNANSSSISSGKWDAILGAALIVAVEAFFTAFLGSSKDLMKSSDERFAGLVASRGGVVLWLVDAASKYELFSDAVSDLSSSDSKSLKKAAAKISFSPDLKNLSRSLGYRIISLWIANNNDPISAASASTSAATADICQSDGDASSSSLTGLEKPLAAYLDSKFINTAPLSRTSAPASVEGEETTATSAAPVTAHAGSPSARDTPNLLLARQLAALMRSSSNDVSTVISKAMALLSPESMFNIAVSGPLSRQIMDTFFAEFAKSRPGDIRSVNTILASVEYVLALAQHYVGQHVLRKAYELCDLRGKEKWVQAITNPESVTAAKGAGKKPLSATKEGRNTLSLVHADVFAKDHTEWRSLVKKQLKADSILTEMGAQAVPAAHTVISNGGTASGASAGSAAVLEHHKAGNIVGSVSAPTAAGVAAASTDDPALNKSGRKRKRKRAGAGANKQANNDDGDDGDEDL